MSTKIEWTNETWNPVVGCTIVSPGCTNCYAMKMAHRIGPNFPHYAGLTTLTKGGPVWTGKVATAPDAIFLQPLSWKRPRRIFVNSMSDLFHEDVAEATIDRVFAVMALTPRHTYQVLTKRADRMRSYMSDPQTPTRIAIAMIEIADARKMPVPELPWPLPNVWLGVSAEDQRRAEERIPLLLDTPAAVRWVSAEPLLGPVDLARWLIGEEEHGVDRSREPGSKVGGCVGWTPPLDWIVAGGESGPGARPAHPDWFRSLRDQCAGAGVPYFFKQWGAWTPGENVERQRGIVKTATWFGGGWTFDRENLADEGGHYDDQPDLYLIGKRAAGHVLDGAVHQAWPQ